MNPALVRGAAAVIAAAVAMGTSTATEHAALRALVAATALLPPRPSEVALVTIDESTVDHPAFAGVARRDWTAPLAQVVDALLESGATVVAVDLVFTHPRSDHPAWLRTLRRGARGGRILVGVVDAPQPAWPTPAQRAAAGGSVNLAIVNLVADSDGVVRALPPVSHGIATMAAAAAERADALVESAVLLAAARRPDFVTWPAAQVLRHRGQPLLVEAFAGRVVFLGPWLSDEERHRSAYGTRPGLWLHALGTDAWIHGGIEDCRGWAPFSGAAGAMTGAAGARRHSRWPLPTAIATAVIATFSAWWWGWWVPGATMLVALLVAALLVVGWGAASIATRVTASIPHRLRDTAVAPRTVTGTVCFIDIAAFTRTGERCDPARLANDLDHCLAALTRIVESRGGFVDKYLGDGLMALFGCDERDAGARAAFGAILACLHERLSLNREPVRLRVGMACGALRVGAIGDSRRIRITAIGDTVNVAARLEQLNRELGTTVLADEAVAAANPDAEWTDHGERRLRGRALPVRVWSTGIIQPQCAPPCSSSRSRYSPTARWSLIRPRAP